LHQGQRGGGLQKIASVHRQFLPVIWSWLLGAT